MNISDEAVEAAEKMSERLEAAMVAVCNIARSEKAARLGAESALAAADAVMFSDEAVERVAEAMWLHRPLERIGMGAPKPWVDLKPYQHDRYRAWAKVALTALRGAGNEGV